MILMINAPSETELSALVDRDQRLTDDSLDCATTGREFGFVPRPPGSRCWNSTMGSSRLDYSYSVTYQGHAA